MCIVAPAPDTDQPTRPDCPAHHLTPQRRRPLALDALAGPPISGLARQHRVSRRFVYRQLHIARDAIDRAFAPPPAPSQRVLFTIAITRQRLQQIVLALVLICHSSLRGVVEFLAAVFDYHLSLGSVFNIVHGAVAAARAVNAREDLSAVGIADHDEIFQADSPVLVGIDARSTYCYLLSREEHCDGDTWGVRLLELVDRGFRPRAAVADSGPGLRSGHKQALGGVPCRADVFHCLYEVGPLVGYLEKRAYQAMETVEKLTRKQQRHEWRHGRQDRKVAGQLLQAGQAMAAAIAVAQDVATLYDWLRQDILGLAGPDFATRRELLDWLVAELQQREKQCQDRIRPVRVLLAKQGKELLAFAEQLDRDLAAVAARWQVGVSTARAVLTMQQLSQRQPRRWQQEARLRQQLGGRFDGLSAAVAELSGQVVRASSLVENLNSRLRNYFFLWRQFGPEYLELLRFFLNHRRFLRSEQPFRAGQSPAELLSGQEHLHWLELLGYQRFQQQ